MSKFLEKNISVLLLAIIGYFLLSFSGSLKESAKYDPDWRACAKMKTFINEKESSKFFEQEVVPKTGIKVRKVE